MKYIKKYEKFTIDNKSVEPVNEFLGGILKDIFKSAKNKISLSISKSIGGAKDVDKAMEEYKNKIYPLIDKELEERKKIITFQTETDGEVDKNELGKRIKEMEKQIANINKQRDAIKQTFDIKLNMIIKNLSDDNIKDYARLKRAELIEEIVAKQLGFLEEQNIDELKDDKYTQDYVKELRGLFTKASDSVKKLSQDINDAISNKKDEGGDSDDNKFDLEAANADPDKYIWEDSPHIKEDLKEGTKLIYFSRSNSKSVGTEYKGDPATVSKDQEDIEDGEIKVVTKNDSIVRIKKSQIIRIDNGEEETKEETKEENKEENKEEDSNIA